MSDKAERAEYTATEQKVAEHLSEAMSYFITLPTMGSDMKKDFAQKILDLRMYVIRSAILREEKKQQAAGRNH